MIDLSLVANGTGDSAAAAANVVAIIAALASDDITIPAGNNFKINAPITIPSGRTIVGVNSTSIIERVGATILDGQESFFRNSDFTGGNANITINGNGMKLRGNGGSYGSWLPVSGLETGVGLRLVNCTGCAISGIVFDDNYDFNIQISDLSNSSFSGITFKRYSNSVGSEDGFHISGGCHHLTITNTAIQGGNNDGIAFNADDDSGANINPGDIHDITVDGVSFNPISGPGFRLLWASHNIYNILVKNVTGSCNQGRLIGVTADVSGSGLVYNTEFRDMTMEMPQDGDFIKWEAGMDATDLTLTRCSCDITGSGKFFNMTGGSIGTLSIIDCGNQNSIPVNFAGTITNKVGNFFPQPAHRKPIRHRAIFS